MDEQGIGDFLDLAYGASIEPDLWPRVLDRFAALVGGAGSAVVWQNQATRLGQGFVVGVDPAILDVYFGAFARRHPSQRWMNNPRDRLRHFVPRIVADDDAMPKAELMRTEFYNDFMRPFDLHSVVRLGLVAQRDDAAFMIVSRPGTRDRFGATELATAARLHPHLIRAFALSQKMDAARLRSEGAQEVLQRSTHGVFVVDADGKLNYANATGEALVTAHLGLNVIGGRLSAHGSEAGARLAALIAQAGAATSAERRGGSMALWAPDRSRPFSVTVAPMREQAAVLFQQGPSVLVCVTDLDVGGDVTEQALRQVLGLSPAEARVAVLLFEGMTPKEAAAHLGLSFNTVREHLARIFDKTGVNRQSELIKLIGRTAAPWTN